MANGQMGKCGQILESLNIYRTWMKICIQAKNYGEIDIWFFF